MRIIYETIMIVLVIVTIIIIWTENTYNSTINWIVWILFFTDFAIRFLIANNKWSFIKQNPFLIIAIIPFDQFFQIARIVRLFYLFRIKTIVKYYATPYVKKLTYQSRTLIAIIIICLLFLESFVVWRVESSIPSFTEAIYVVFGHLLFFGHRIFIIDQSLSVSLLTLTSIFGVVIQGLALQWAFSKIEKVYKKMKKEKDTYRESS